MERGAERSAEPAPQRWRDDFDAALLAVDVDAGGSSALHTMVSVMRESRLPTLLAWGPELRILYNEAFVPVLGARHPALGARAQDVWADAWPAMERCLRRALHGQPCTLDDLAVPGGDAQRWFTLAFTRAAGDDHRSAGLLCVATETTGRMALERRHAFELLLADQLRTFSTPRDVAAQACRLLGQHLAAARVSYVEIGAAGDTVRVLQDWTDGELPSQSGRELATRDFGTRVLAQLRAGRVIRINDFAKDQNGDTGWDSDFVCVQSHSMLAVPLFRGGRLHAVLQVDGTAARRWTDDEVGLAMELAQRTAAALEAASADEHRRRVEDELHSAAARQAFQLELADLLRPLTDPQAVVEAATALLGRHLGVARVLHAEVDEDQRSFRVRSDWTAPGVASFAGVQRPLDDFGEGTAAALRRGETIVVNDVARDPRSAGQEPVLDAAGVRAFVLVPVLQSGRLSIVLNLHEAQPREWRPVDLQRAADMAERTWVALDAARAHAALRAERDQARYVLDTIAEGFLLVDRHGHIAQLNAEGARIGHVQPGAVVGRHLWELWPSLRQSKLAELYEHVTITGQPGALEYRRRQIGVLPEWIEVRALPALHGGVAVFFRDIDQRKRAEEQLQHADRRKNEFLAMLAHELRNPLAPIAGAAHMLGMPGIELAHVRRAGELIERQVQQMTTLVSELLDASRITQGLVHLDWELVDVGEVVPSALEQVDPLVRSRGHTLTVALPAAAVRVRADRHRFVQVLANLLTNAARYTPPGGRIELRVDADETEVTLALRDNGIGMTPELLATAFELFTQGERRGEEARDGLGIGLALVRGLVELFGGTVSAHSEGPGRGSEFVVTLPRAG